MATPQVAGSETWGRVADDGTVYVRVGDEEREVGQYPDGDPAEALALFARKYDGLAFEVELLERRVQAGTANPDEARGAVRQLSKTVAEAHVVGDLAALAGRLEALSPLIDEAREARRAEKAAKTQEATEAKERLVTEAERLGQSNEWRAGADRLRALLEEWKALPRVERAVDDALWKRFSGARTNYTRRRKAHFGELNEKREGARTVKEKLVAEAEALSGSTDWGPTSGAYRELMRRWKAAGPAPKEVDDELWGRFRAAQDTFFGARDAENAAAEAEFVQNAEVKERILVEAEALLPVTDLARAKAVLRDLGERWESAGKVPRDRMNELEGRMRAVEQAIRGADDDAWRSNNPEARARAADAVAQLEAGLAELAAQQEKAEAAGNATKAAEHAASIQARREWLTQAQKALADFS